MVGQVTYPLNAGNRGTVAAATSNVFTLTLGAAPPLTGFQVSYNAATTAVLSPTITAAALQAAIGGLAGIGMGNVTVTGPNGGPFAITLSAGLPSFTAFGASFIGGTGTLAATGGFATVEVPVPRLESWYVTRVAVLASSNVLEPVAKIYVDTVTDLNFLAGTYTGSNDSSDEMLHLRPGQKLIATWSGADAGAAVTLSIFGQKTASG